MEGEGRKVREIGRDEDKGVEKMRDGKRKKHVKRMKMGREGKMDRNDESG